MIAAENLQTIITVFAIEFLWFVLVSAVVHHTQPWYQKRHLTIVPVFASVVSVGITMMTLARVVPVELTWREYEYLTVLAFLVSFVPVAIQQGIRKVINGAHREHL
jgi:hypothetical protein